MIAHAILGVTSHLARRFVHEEGQPWPDVADAAVAFCLEGPAGPHRPAVRLTQLPSRRGTREGQRISRRAWSGPAQVADGLADALLVLDEREAHVAVAAGPEADARATPRRAPRCTRN